MSQRMISVFWRLRRVSVFEAALMVVLELEQEDENRLNFSSSSRSVEEEEKSAPRLGRTVKEFLSPDLSGKLNRHEMNFWTQLSPFCKSWEHAGVAAQGDPSYPAAYMEPKKTNFLTPAR